jgi:hypothetical protein
MVISRMELETQNPEAWEVKLSTFTPRTYECLTGDEAPEKYKSK